MWWFIKARAGVCVSISRTLTRKPQGMIVAILFCLINNEVIFQVKKFFADRTGHGQGGRHPSLALTQYTVRSHSYNKVGGRAQLSGTFFHANLSVCASSRTLALAATAPSPAQVLFLRRKWREAEYDFRLSELPSASLRAASEPEGNVD